MASTSTPNHSQAARFRKSGLFCDLTSFAELEARIAALPRVEDRGAAFEVFVEAYLSTQKLVQAAAVWPGENVPADVKRKLRLPSKDMGVDGVIQDTMGAYNTYQAKFRSSRPSLSWTELSTFFGLSDSADGRVLITNCNDVADIAESRVGFCCIRGIDLDRLHRRDFEAINRWLNGATINRQPKTPWPHQKQAVRAIAARLASDDRVSAVMPCGTGKTLVSLWLAEQMGCERVLVLVPSLALVRQTLHEWLRETHWEQISFRCVCCDPQVSKGADELIVRQSDLDFRVNTESEEVADFLARPFDGIRVVFSTYQSASVVAEALNGLEPFDLGIFDEAHKTAGRLGTRFSFALDDRNLPVKKRVFLTATPRHYDVSRRNKEGDAKLVYSMDVRENYGPNVHTLSFAEAARREIICNYKVIISVVTSQMVNESLLRRGEVIVKGDAVKARQVANQIAIERAISEHDIKRVFTFHSTVASAKSFVADGGEGVQSHLSGFEVFHVNGKMRTADREETLRRFTEVDRGLVSNARCLTEGVDVPAVDMVAFMSPKKSKVDIVQATGRAMRKDPCNPQKATGYVLVPMFVETASGESIEQAVERTDFSDVWNVLEAMQEQDEVLAELIRHMREDKGRTKGFDDSRFREQIEVLGPTIGLANLRKAIAARCIDRLASTWDQRYGELERFKEIHGHCNVSREWSEIPQLGTWVSTQRSSRIQGTLSSERLARLDKLGFVWDVNEAAWEEMFAKLREYKAEHGHCNVPTKFPQDPKFGSWTSTQRTLKRDGKLSDDRLARLDQLGFVWHRLESAWEKNFAALKIYKAAQGDCNVPATWLDNPQLGKWVNKQRTAKRKNRLSGERIARLEKIEFEWEPRDVGWEEMYTLLVAYKSQRGDCNVLSDWREQPQLGVWVAHQRAFRNSGQMTAERFARLDALGFVWDTVSAAWEEKFAALQEYKAHHGHCNVPAIWPDDAKLGIWVAHQRRARKRNELSEARIARLDALGFVWNVLRESWEDMYRELRAYRAKYGDCNVPTIWPKNPQLGRWVNSQRRARSRGKLSVRLVTRLEKLGFDWDRAQTWNDTWRKMLDDLKAYKTKYGHCNVPTTSPGNSKLAKWINKQRMAKKEGRLGSDRIALLENLGFVWNTLDAAWEEMYASLSTYKSHHGDCNVPQNWPRLGSWVTSQRQLRRKNKLSGERVALLEELGFVWDTDKAAWDEMIAALESYKAHYGDCRVPAKWANNPRLGMWVSNQRANKKRGQLRNNRIAQLEAIGFDWEPRRSN